MEIVTQQLADALEVKVRGRLDNYWTEHLRSNLEELIRGGAHVIRLNLSEILFLSSAGVGLLVMFHRQLKSIGGSFFVVSPSDRVKQVLDLCGLAPILLAGGPAPAVAAHNLETRRFSTDAGSFEVVEYGSAKPLKLERIGDPSLLHGCRFGAEHCRSVSYPAATFGFGLGAFGEGFDDAQPRFGEFLAVGGSAAYLPTDGTNVPDFMVSSGNLVPEVNVLYGVRGASTFASLLRFEAASADAPLTLTQLVRTALEVSGAPTLGMVMIGESAGLVGAALRRSPAMAMAATAGGPDAAPFRYPEIRSWLSFSTERLFLRSLVLVSGIAAASSSGPLQALLRPVGAEPSPVGHFHAAAFSYRPLPKGNIDLQSTVSKLFETETLQGVLHLLGDARGGAGAQESEFVRGACWLGTVSEVTAA